MTALMHISGIGKRYPGAIALDDVALAVHPGEIVALVGENGAGKTTLINILGGVLEPDTGTLHIGEMSVRFRSPADAQRMGIGVIHQDLRLVPELTVAENILLGNEPVSGMFGLIDRPRMASTAGAALAQIGSAIPLDVRVDSLAPADRQLVAIARVLSRSPKILALDEPTASLSGRETEALFTILRKLRDEGTGIIYISHRLEEVLLISDRIAVLRDGRMVHAGPTSDLSRAQLITLMVGRELAEEFPTAHGTQQEEVLRLDRISGRGVTEVSLSLHRGEVFGLAGLVGAGRTELARLIFGADLPTGGRMLLEGRPFHPRSPRDAIREGIGLLTEDRNRLGLILTMNIRENITLPTLHRFLSGVFISSDDERRAAGNVGRRLAIKTPSVENSIDSLSGGNRQKVVLGRWLLNEAKLFIFDEPTTGIDVGARREIYDIIHGLARRGLAVLVISSDLPELLGICDRIAVMRDGLLTGTITRDKATQESVMDLATGSAGSTA